MANHKCKDFPIGISAQGVVGTHYVWQVMDGPYMRSSVVLQGSSKSRRQAGIDARKLRREYVNQLNWEKN